MDRMSNERVSVSGAGGPRAPKLDIKRIEKHSRLGIGDGGAASNSGKLHIQRINFLRPDIAGEHWRAVGSDADLKFRTVNLQISR